MKLLLILLLLPKVAWATDLEDQLVQNLSPKAVSASELAIEIEAVAVENNIEPKMLAAMVLNESRGVATAYNPITHDHGLTQINNATAIDLGISIQCLYDWKCNLRVGAKLFAAHRPCLYNLGRYRKLEGRYLDLCHAYEAKLALLY